MLACGVLEIKNWLEKWSHIQYAVIIMDLMDKKILCLSHDLRKPQLVSVQHRCAGRQQQQSVGLEVCVVNDLKWSRGER